MPDIEWTDSFDVIKLWMLLIFGSRMQGEEERAGYWDPLLLERVMMMV